MDAAINSNPTSINTIDAIWNLIHCQSASVRKAVQRDEEIGAGEGENAFF